MKILLNFSVIDYNLFNNSKIDTDFTLLLVMCSCAEKNLRQKTHPRLYFNQKHDLSHMVSFLTIKYYYRVTAKSVHVAVNSIWNEWYFPLCV